MLKILMAALVAVTVFSTAAAFGQVTMGAAPQEDIEVAIDSNGTAHVLHIVAGNATSPVAVQMIAGNYTGLSVTDVQGNSVQYSSISGNPMSVMIFPTQRNETLISYNLPKAVTDDNGVWRWDYFAPSDAAFTDFHFPKGVDTIWVVSDDKSTARPVYLAGKGLRQIGNGMHLAYVTNEPVKMQAVQWGNQTFNVGISTLANVGPAAFDQSARAYGFDIDKAGSFVTVIMPKALLWGPYQGKINSNATLTNEFHDNDTYAWIGLMPTQSGTVQITGTTAIPEFPLFVPLAFAISAVVATRFFTKLNFK